MMSSLGILFEKRLLAVSKGLLQGNATLFPEAKRHSLSACATLCTRRQTEEETYHKTANRFAPVCIDTW